MFTKRAVLRFGLFGLWLLVWLATSSIARADILRWDNGQVIPGTEGIVPGPVVELSHRQLEFASLNLLDLTDATFYSSDLSYADLAGTNLTNADLARIIHEGRNKSASESV